MSQYLGEVYALMRLDVSHLTKDIQKAGMSMQSISSTIGNVGMAMTGALTVPIAALAKQIVDIGSTFDATMSEVAAVMMDTTLPMDEALSKVKEDYADLREEAMRLGQTTIFDPQQTAEGMAELARAGFNATETIDAMQYVLYMAQAGAIDLASASEIAVNVLNGFGLEVKDAATGVNNMQRVADILAVTANATTTDIQGLGTAFSYTASYAHAAGWSIEETAAALGILSNRGIEASKAGTTVRAILMRIAKPTKQAQEAMDRLGLEYYNADGTMKSMAEVVNLTRSSFEKLTTEQKLNAATTIFGAQAANGMLALIQATPEDIADLSASIENATGASKNMAEVMVDNAQGAFKLLKASAMTTAISFWEVLEPAVRDITMAVKDFISFLGGLDENTKKTIAVIAGVAAAIGPVLLIIKAVMAVIGFIASPVTLVLGLIGLLAYALYEAYKTSEPFQKAVDSLMESFKGLIPYIQEVWENLQSKLGPFIGALIRMFTNLAEGAKPFVDSLGPIISSVGNFIGAVMDVVKNLIDWYNGNEELQANLAAFGGKIGTFGKNIVDLASSLLHVLEPAIKFVADAFSYAVSLINPFIDIVNGVIDVLVGMFTGDWSRFGEGFKEIFAGADDYLKAFTEGSIDMIGSFVNNALDILLRLFGFDMAGLTEGLASVPEALSGLGQSISDSMASAWDSVTGWFSGMADEIGTLVGGIPEAIGGAFSSVGQAISDWAGNTKQAFLDWVADTQAAFAEFFDNLPYKIGYALGRAVRAIIDFSVNAWNAIVNFVTTTATSIYTFFSELPGKIMAWLTQAGENIYNWAVKAYTDSVEWIGNTINSIVTFFSELPGKIWDWLLETATKTQQWLEETYKKVVEWIPKAIDAVVTFFSELPGKLWTWLTATVQKIIDFGGNVLTEAGNAARNVWTGFIDGISGIPGKVKEIFENVIKTLKGMATGLWKSARQIASDLWEGFKDGLGIRSPSYIEEAMFNIEDESARLVKMMNSDFNKLSGVPIEKTYKMVADADAALTEGSGVAAGTGGTSPSAPVQKVEHYGTIRVEGVNDEGQLVGVVNKTLQFESLLDYRKT